MNTRLSLHLLLAAAAGALLSPASSLAVEPTAGAAAGTTTETSAPAPTEEAPAVITSPGKSPPAPSSAPRHTPTPQVQGQRSQGSTPGRRATQQPAAKSKPAAPNGEPRAPAEGSPGVGANAKLQPPLPSALTPSLPFALQGSIAGVPSFFIESFRIPPFLLPIFQAAGTAYGIPWQVLAAINEVETDYGRDLSVSSAGAEGWMQFLPSSWEQYGVDANGDGFKDPYNPADAIFAAARYLRAAGADTNIKAGVFSYNHSQAYVSSVMLRAQLLGGTPSELLGAITGLTEARFPVHAAAHFSDGFATVAAKGSSAPKTIAGTTI
jgi:hypothetical protein